MKFEKIDSYERLAALIKGHFKIGVETNAFASRDEYERLIENGTLWYAENESTLWLLSARDGFHRLNFYLHSEADCDTEFPSPTVCEIAYKRASPASVECLSKMGFEPVLTRLRYTRNAGGENAVYDRSIAVRPAEDRETNTVHELLEASFDKLTGCLPTVEELSRESALVAVISGEIVGALHYVIDGKTAEIKHLAVSESHRGMGIGSALVGSFAERYNDRKIRVWCVDSRIAARKTYEKHGFQPDGFLSVVLKK